jgi:hypothetical protein
VVIATEKFDELARQSAVQSGLPDARIVVVPHPIGGVSKDALERLSDDATEEVVAQLLGR